MKIATYIFLAIAMISVGLIGAGIYLYGMDLSFGAPIGRSAWTPRQTDEGTQLAAFGILGFLFSILGFLALLIIAGIKRLFARA